MPLNFIASVAKEGTAAIPAYEELKTYLPPLLVTAGVKYYFGGSRNTWERKLHGKVAIVTGGTSGLGASVVKEIATRGCQVVLLVRNLKDGWLAEYISNLREETNNPCIYAEEADLADLYSVRKFATKWIDNMGARRLDMVICCAAVAQPPSVPRQASADGLELQMQVNYFSHYHLLMLLAPAVRAQPADRDVRIILTTCVASVMGDLELSDLAVNAKPYKPWAPHRVLGASKLALALFGYEYQRQMNAYVRKDRAPCNVHVAVVDPGMMRSPSFKRWFSCGSLWGLLLYIVLWPIWWLFFKTSIQGSQSMQYAVMCPEIGETAETAYVSECRVRSMPPRSEFKDAEYQKKLVEATEHIVTAAEKQTVIERKRQEAASSSDASASES